MTLPNLQRLLTLLLSCIVVAACIAPTASVQTTAIPTMTTPSTASAPTAATPTATDTETHMEAQLAERVTALLAQMTLAEKIGQMTQVEKNSIKRGDITKYFIGSILSGGGGSPSPTQVRLGRRWWMAFSRRHWRPGWRFP